jgi:prepilin-type N-terminal cleavage/methylation domain-containing protein
MKIPSKIPLWNDLEKAFTIVELMIAMTIFSMALIGVIYLHLFGLQQDKLVNSKLGASDQSRRGYDNLMRDVRSCKAWEIGNVDGTGINFTAADLGTTQQGNALCLNYTTNVANVTGKIIYYFNTNANALMRVRPRDMYVTKVADGLTNVFKSMIFEAQNFDGTPQTTRSHKGVICVWMEFKQFQYPLTQVGNGALYDYYRMHFKITSHVPDGI